jgi:hypothetical protein
MVPSAPRLHMHAQTLKAEYFITEKKLHKLDQDRAKSVRAPRDQHFWVGAE